MNNNVSRALNFAFIAAAVTSITNASASYAVQAWDTYKNKPLTEVRALAEQGDLAAQSSLANRLLRGIGTQTDVAAGIVWYRKAASKKFPPAMTSLGDLYQEGAVIKEDKKMAANLFEEAAALNYPRAQCKLGYLYLWDQKDGGLQNFDKGMQLLQRSANAGYFPAAERLADLYKGGSTKLKKDDKEAIRWYKMAWDLGSKYAGNHLADVYFNGKGTGKDVRLAVVYFSRYEITPEGEHWYKRLSGKQAVPEQELRQAVQWMCLASKNSRQHSVDDWTALHAK